MQMNMNKRKKLEYGKKWRKKNPDYMKKYLSKYDKEKLGIEPSGKDFIVKYQYPIFINKKEQECAGGELNPGPIVGNDRF